nr:putative reverse transcriptase domain-containing protein [Tanacetum cinerariifolium]
ADRGDNDDDESSNDDKDDDDVEKDEEDKEEEEHLALANPSDVSTDDNEKEHEEHLKEILELLEKEELYAKFSMCEFWIPKVQFLGQVIDSQGIYVDPAKIKSVKDWASPKSPMK